MIPKGGFTSALGRGTIGDLTSCSRRRLAVAIVISWNTQGKGGY